MCPHPQMIIPIGNPLLVGALQSPWEQKFKSCKIDLSRYWSRFLATVHILWPLAECVTVGSSPSSARRVVSCFESQPPSDIYVSWGARLDCFFLFNWQTSKLFLKCICSGATLPPFHLNNACTPLNRNSLVDCLASS